jgi:hypothetical protein
MTEHVHYLKPPKVKRSKGRARPNEPLAMWCELGLVDSCTGRAEVRHHILRRSQGGSDEASNTLDLCDADHRWIHDHPAVSYERGWLRHPGAA